MSLGLFSFFSYPLSYPINLVILAINLAIILSPTAIKNNSLNFTNKAFTLLISSLSFILSSYALYSELQWRKAQDLSIHKADTTLNKYMKLYSQRYFKQNGAFLYDYAIVMYDNENHNKCLSILSDCEKYINDYDTQMMSGYCYKELGQWSKAKHYFNEAHYMVPHKFTPLFELMMGAYIENDAENAVFLAQLIIDKPIKVKSYKISIMKNKAKEILSENEKGGDDERMKNNLNTKTINAY